ncbi:hypothetical protein [Photobacterium leiognathi]|uniref:hypothetical protein n=1 Tax=Photobacterium leiognathi TaxID=553611 RepID=UPI0027398DC9|nr:hypothetical protein [Photobacterium leiognathi]
MDSSDISNVLVAIDTCTDDFTLGFKRYITLPSHVRLNIATAYYLETGCLDYLPRIKKFLGDMTEDEYINWLKLA